MICAVVGAAGELLLVQVDIVDETLEARARLSGRCRGARDQPGRGAGGSVGSQGRRAPGARGGGRAKPQDRQATRGRRGGRPAAGRPPPLSWPTTRIRGNGGEASCPVEAGRTGGVLPASAQTSSFLANAEDRHELARGSGAARHQRLGAQSDAGGRTGPERDGGGRGRGRTCRQAPAGRAAGARRDRRRR